MVETVVVLEAVMGTPVRIKDIVWLDRMSVLPPTEREELVVGIPGVVTTVVGIAVVGTPVVGTPVVGTPVVGTPVVGTPVVKEPSKGGYKLDITYF